MRLLIILSFIVLISGCTSVQTIDRNLSRDEVISAIRIGEEISIQTKDNRKFPLVVREITEQAIIGEDGRQVLFEDIREIEAREISILKTAGVVGGAYAILAGLAFLSLAISL